jgi:hypothetical protein
VKDPKNLEVPGAKVAMVAPMSKGTTINPPGTRSIERIRGICFMATANQFYRRAGPNNCLSGEIPAGFLLSVIVGTQCFADIALR